MKKLLVLAMSMAMIFTFAACGSGGSSSGSADADNTAVSEMTKLTVGFDAEYPPYGFKDEATGEYTGVDLELAQEVCERRGWELVKQPIDWDSKDMELNSGTIDCIWNGMTYTGKSLLVARASWHVG